MSLRVLDELQGKMDTRESASTLPSPGFGASANSPLRRPQQLIV